MKRHSGEFDEPAASTSKQARLSRPVCVAFGTTHQGAMQFEGRGNQCTAIAAMSLIVSSVDNHRSTISLHDIDTVLKRGDKLYIQLKKFIPAQANSSHLNCDEIPTEIIVGQKKVIIENNWITNGFYPSSDEALEYNTKLVMLEIILNNEVFTPDWDDDKDGVVFTGRHYSISFWRHTFIADNKRMTKYFVFNSHAVNESNEHSGYGVARIFQLDNVKSLANVLLQYNRHASNSQQYELNKIKVKNVIELDDARYPATQVSSNQTQCSNSSVSAFEVNSIQSAPSDVVLNTVSDRTECSQSSVTTIEKTHPSPSVLNDLMLLTNDVSVPSSHSPSQISISQISSISASILTSAPSYAEVVKKNLQKPVITTTKKTVKITNAQTKTKTVSNKKPVVVIERVDDFKLTHLKPVVVLNRLESDQIKPTTTTKRGRPIKNKRGRKKTTENAHLDAVTKYNKNKPEIHRESVKKYTHENLEVHRESVKKYTQKRPEIHRESVKNYTLKNPEIHRESVKTYTEQNPEVHREAVQKYNEINPEINRQSTQIYNQVSRNVDVPLRRSHNLIGEKRDDELNAVRSFTLKKQSLKSSEIHKCRHCQAPLFDEEKTRTQWCCGSGANNVQVLPPLTTEDFYTHPSFESRPRAYNNLFAFSALGVSHGFQHLPGLSFIKIQGRVYHRVFDLAYKESTNNIGLYISDSSERESLARNQSLDVQVTVAIRTYLENVNPYITCFRRLSLEASDEAFLMFEKTSRATHGNILGDQPVGREVSAIISTDREQYVPRSIAIWKIGERPHTVDIMDPLYESFQYPLLYPHGNPGWYPGKLDNNGKKLTQARYVRCLLLSEDRFSHLGRLSEEWLVDMYCRISEERLRYILHMQTNPNVVEIRAAPLLELLNDETIAGEGVVPGRIYLPNTFTGGPRYMKLKYLDCIALVNRLGPPSYFVTFTCNPNWPEIKHSTPEGQRPNPLICARVFNLRLFELIHDLRSGAWFGTIDYLTYVIEFQKRGLPHAHICFRVQGGGPVENSDIDKVCRADIPDESEAEGRLRTAVLNHMIHGPCGHERDNLPCYDNEKQKCSRRFPKRETDVTFSDERGFIHLQRNSKNEGIIKFRNREIKVNDLWVVPYNASLLLKYDAHINVEISSHRSVVKYLFKYMTKGLDEARVAIVNEEQNEIEDYVTKRYIGSSDAAWRVLEFDVTAREPNVKQLGVHLENRQTVYFKPDHENDVNHESSDLLTYFNRPQGVEFDSLKYVDFYENYLVHAKRPNTKVEVRETSNGKFVTERQRGRMVARLFWVSPNRGEQFYLRILLNSFACRGYSDLLNLGGPDCTTFQEAAKAVGLADDEVEYERAMQEASTFFTGYRLRRFFVMLAVNGAPVATLWDTFKNLLSEDILHRMPDQHDNAYNTCLIEIGRLLRKHGSSLSLMGLPEVQDDSTELRRECNQYNTNEQIAIVDEWLPKLSSEQRAIFQYIDNLCTDQNFRENNPCAIFIDGPAGTGKTTLLNTITAHVRGTLESIAICTASSAIAAQNLENASTAHSAFKFPLQIEDEEDIGSVWQITNRSQRAELISHAAVLIYDEAPMAHKYLIHILDRSLRDLMRCNKMFGGKIIIFAGDFRQIPPVVVNAKSDSDILNSSLKKSPLWPNLKKFSLISSQRCRDDPEYADFLLRLGSNQLASLPLQVGRNVQKIVSLELIEHVTELSDLIDFVFSEAIIDEPDVCALRAILCTRNDAVREINSIILDRVSGDTLHFYSNDKIVSDDADELYLGPDALNRLQPTGVPEFDLKLKVGCVCMITRNLSFADGLVNGTKVIIEATSPLLITVRKRGCYDNIPYLIPRILFKAPIERNSPYEMSRRQFPLQVCYAMTIHKSQGQTITRVGVDLRSDVFSHGQLYVALGRVQEKESIKILVQKNRVINGIACANNKIIPDLLN